jgi:Protein of unknown function (DUF4197)
MKMTLVQLPPLAALLALALTLVAAPRPALALDNQQASAGIKEALTNATNGAVNLVGRPGGYFDNPAIKILLPSQLQPVEKGLRAIGAGAQVDKFEKSMNDAAEAAAPKAEPIFEKAIRGMSISDAERIVDGGKTSATDYFRRKTSGELTTAFTPIVKQAMAKYSVTQQYESLMGKYQSGSALGGLLGGMTGKFDLDSYVVHKSLDGLFYMVGQEERKIRTNPAAQVTPLLREVFGGK